MSHEAEALFVILFYVILVSIVLLFGIVVLFLIDIRRRQSQNEEKQEFTKLMIELYEIEKEKNQKIDEGGFGT